MRKPNTRKVAKKQRPALAAQYRKYLGPSAPNVPDNSSLEQPSPLQEVPSYATNGANLPVPSK
jgi:hypothetical protein